MHLLLIVLTILWKEKTNTYSPTPLRQKSPFKPLPYITLSLFLTDVDVD